MIVILTKDVKGLGHAGEVVKVSDGHARNLLLPKGLATEATDGNVRTLEKQKQVLEEKRRKELEAASALAERLSSISVTINMKSGEGGRLFGSITSKDIAEALSVQHKLNFDKRKIVLENPLKNVGEHKVEIKLFPEVSATIKVVVES